MLSAFIRAFRTPDLRKKLLFVLGIIVLFRLGSQLPTPNVNYATAQQCLSAATAQEGTAGNVYGLVNLFSGGALLQLSVFSLGIMPYITASIILQLLTVVIPRIEMLKKEGQSGTAKITQYTRYLTVALAILQSTGIVAMAQSGALFQNNCPGLLYDDSILSLLIMVTVMTSGTAVIMWLGELITDRGVGNGMSILIFCQVIAVFPAELWRIGRGSPGMLLLVFAGGLVLVAAVVFIEQAQRRIPVQYAKRMVGRRMYGGTSTYIPLKVNQAGIIPVIFASSMLYLPQLIVGMFRDASTNPVMQWVSEHLVSPNAPIYMIVSFVLVVFFTYFYVSITFNPNDVADNMKKYGGFIPGIRPGRPTAEYLSYVLYRLTCPGSLYLGTIYLIPMVAIGLTATASQNFPFGGTSILIMVGVGLDTVKQIESQLQQRNYEGFLR